MKNVDKNQTLGYTRLNETGNSPKDFNKECFTRPNQEQLPTFDLVHFVITTARGVLKAAENLDPQTGLTIVDGDLNLDINFREQLTQLFAPMDEDGEPEEGFEVMEVIEAIVEKLDELLAQMPHA